MNDIVSISKTNTQFPVDARELHEKLKVQTPFNKWIQRRFSDALLDENFDYQSLGQNCPKPQGGRPTIEYRLSIDAAKEIAMLERNETGKQIRNYFIKAEQLLREGPLAGKELPNRTVNGRLMYDYKRTLQVLGLSLRSGSVGSRRRKHFTEFTNIDGTWYISADFASMLARNIELRQNYIALAERREQVKLEWERRQMKFPHWK